MQRVDEFLLPTTTTMFGKLWHPLAFSSSLISQALLSLSIIRVRTLACSDTQFSLVQLLISIHSPTPADEPLLLDIWFTCKILDVVENEPVLLVDPCYWTVSTDWSIKDGTT